MKLIDEIKEKYPTVPFEYKVEKIEGYNYSFHSLYVKDECIISIAEGYEPTTGKEKNEIYLMVETSLREHYPKIKF